MSLRCHQRLFRVSDLSTFPPYSTNGAAVADNDPVTGGASHSCCGTTQTETSHHEKLWPIPIELIRWGR